jgi:DNA-binding transcriptional regulator LsrR (DeoR family)
VDTKELERQETLRKKRECFDLYVNQKLPYRVIAERMNLSILTVRRYVQELILLNIPEEDIEELRRIDIDGYLHSERLCLKSIELVTSQIDAKVAANETVDSKVVELLSKLNDQLVSIRKARAMLLGMNKPVLVSHAVAVRVQYDEKLESLVSELTGGGTLLSGPEDLYDQNLD